MQPVVHAGLTRKRLGWIGYRTLSEVTGRACSLGLVVLTARWLPTREFGWFSLAWAGGWLISIAGDFGLQIYLTRQVARRPDAARKIFLRLLKLRLGAVGVLLVTVLLALRWLAPEDRYWPLLAIVCSHLALNLVDFFNHLFRGLERSQWEASVNLFHRALALALAVLLFIPLPGLEAPALALFASAAAALAVVSRLAFGRAFPNGSQSPDEPIVLLPREIWPIGAGIFLSALYFRLDLFILESFHGAREVGLYHAVFRLVDASRMIPAAVLAVVFPWLCRPGSHRVFRQTLVGLLGVGLPAAGVGWVVSDHVISLVYGARFLPAAPALRLLMFSVPLFFVNFLLTHQLIADGREKAFALICAGALVSSLLLTLLLIPRWSMVGAAWACLLREGLILAACRGILKGGRRSESGGGLET